MSKISEAIKKLAGTDSLACMNGEVVNIDKAEMTCEVSFGAEDSIIASLVCGDKKNGIVQIPKVESRVVVMFRSLSVGFVVMVDEVEEILINGGENGGLVISGSLIERLNSIEKDINSLKQVVTTWVPVPNDGGAAFKTAAATWSGQSLQETQIEDLENDIIKH